MIRPVTGILASVILAFSGTALSNLNITVYHHGMPPQKELLDRMTAEDDSIFWKHDGLMDIHEWESDVLLVPGNFDSIAESEKKTENLHRLQALGVGVFIIDVSDETGEESYSIRPTEEAGDHLEKYEATVQKTAPKKGEEAIVLLEADGPDGTIPVALVEQNGLAGTVTLYSGADIAPHSSAVLGGLRWLAGLDKSGEGKSIHLASRDQAILDMMEEYRDGGDHWALDHVRHLARRAAGDETYLRRAEFLLERSFHATEEAPQARLFLLDTMAELGSPAHTDVAAHNILHDKYGESARALLVAIGSQRSREILFDAFLQLPNERREPIIRAMGQVGATNSLLSLGDMLVNGDPELAPAIMEAMLEMNTRVSLRILQRADLPENLGEQREGMYIQHASRHVEEGNHRSAATLFGTLRRSSSPGARKIGFSGLLDLPDANRPQLVAGAVSDEVLHESAIKALEGFSEEERDAFVEHVRGLESDDDRCAIMTSLEESSSSTARSLLPDLEVEETDAADVD